MYNCVYYNLKANQLAFTVHWRHLSVKPKDEFEKRDQFHFFIAITGI